MNSEAHALPVGATGQWREIMQAAAVEDWQRAFLLARKLHEQAPGHLPILVQAASLAQRAGHYREAVSMALRAACLPPWSPELVARLVRLLRHFEQPEAVQRVISDRGGAWRNAASPELLVEVALNVGNIGLHREAIALLDEVIARAPNHAHAYYLRGAVQMFSGDRPASVTSLHHAKALSVDLPHAHFLLSLQAGMDCAANEVESIEARLSSPMLSSQAEAYLSFALHNWLDRLGDHDGAWMALERGCRVKRAISPFDSDQDERLFDALQKSVFASRQFMPRSSAEPGLIFIVGMHRSGTTLLERALAGHPDVADGGESYVMSAAMREATNHDTRDVVDEEIVVRAGDADFELVRERVFAYARWKAEGRSWLTEKLPTNFMNIGFIAHAFPEAKILHMRRDPVATCFSNLRTFFGDAASYTFDQVELAGRYRRYRRLMDHWHESFPGRILDVDYEAFVDDPEAMTARVLGFCGLRPMSGLLKVGQVGGVVATASAHLVRDGVVRNRDEAWKAYARWLRPLREALGVADA